jgi:hypothetical protein
VIPVGAALWEEHNRGKAQKAQEAQLVASYKGMLEMHPVLGAHQDRVRVQRMFNTLATVNPTLAADPHAAGAYIRRAIDDDQLDTGAGTIALVDMASRFDASRRAEPALRSWQRAEFMQARGDAMLRGTMDAHAAGAKRLQEERDAPINEAKRELEILDISDRLSGAKQRLKARQAQKQLFP